MAVNSRNPGRRNGTEIAPGLPPNRQAKSAPLWASRSTWTTSDPRNIFPDSSGSSSTRAPSLSEVNGPVDLKIEGEAEAGRICPGGVGEGFDLELVALVLSQLQTRPTRLESDDLEHLLPYTRRLLFILLYFALDA
jgi:hypothetical protein